MNNFVRRDVERSMEKLLVTLLLVGCGGSPFEPALFNSSPEDDAGNVASSGGAAGIEEDAGAGGSNLGGAGAATETGGVGSGGATGTGGTVDVETGGETDAGSGGGAPCLTDLSGVGTGDFSIHFTLTTTEHILTLGLLSQRTGCDEASTYWDITLGPTGGITAVMNDGTHRISVEAGNSLNDGKPHTVDVVRRDGQFWYTSDGTINSAPTPDPYSFRTFPPLVIGSSACAWATPVTDHATISDVCLTVK